MPRNQHQSSKRVVPGNLDLPSSESSKSLHSLDSPAEAAPGEQIEAAMSNYILLSFPLSTCCSLPVLYSSHHSHWRSQVTRIDPATSEQTGSVANKLCATVRSPPTQFLRDVHPHGRLPGWPSALQVAPPSLVQAASPMPSALPRTSSASQGHSSFVAVRLTNG